MGEELAKLLEVGFIREIKQLDWLANLVMVPKKDKSWRLCFDFKDFIIASRAYFLQSPTCTRVNNLVHIVM